MKQKLLSLSFFVLCSLSCKQDSISPNVPGLSAYYSFTNGVRDESNNGNTAQIRGAVPTADRFGNPESAFAFNGYSFIELPPNTFNTPEFTYSAWVKFNKTLQPGDVLTIVNTGSYIGDHAMVLARTTVLGWGM